MKRHYTVLTILMVVLYSSAFAGYGHKKSKYQLTQFTPNRSITALQATSANKGITEGGFYFHFNPFLPGKKYLWPKSIEINNRAVSQDTVQALQDAGKWKFGYGLEIGNMFRLVDSEPIAIGLKIAWLDFGFSSFKNSGGDYSTLKGWAVDLRAIKIGPYFTYALTDQMAVDAYYQFSPTFAFGGITGTYDSDNDGDDELYVFPILQYGFTHEMGVMYRFDMLSLGFAYNAGNLNTNVTVDDGTNTNKIDAKMYARNWRFMIGMKL